MTEIKNHAFQTTTRSVMEVGGLITFSIVASKFTNYPGNSVVHFEDRGWAGGGLLGVIIKDTNGNMEMIGSAFMVAPGIGISASHLFKDRNGSMKNLGGVLLFGIAPTGMQLWECKKILPGEIDDVAILVFSPFYQMPRKELVSRFALTARHPRVGGRVYIVGYRAESFQQGINFHSAVYDIYVSSGIVKEVHLLGRDKGLMPYASFQIDCESLNGMSGGPIIDEDGYVIGVISTGFGDKKEGYVTYGACIFSCLCWEVPPVWPKGAYPAKIRLSDGSNPSYSRRAV